MRIESVVPPVAACIAVRAELIDMSRSQIVEQRSRAAPACSGRLPSEVCVAPVARAPLVCKHFGARFAALASVVTCSRSRTLVEFAQVFKLVPAMQEFKLAAFHGNS